MIESGLSELELENKKVRKTFITLKKNWYHRKHFKCPFLNQEDVPYRKTMAYFVDFLFISWCNWSTFSILSKHKNYVHESRWT